MKMQKAVGAATLAFLLSASAVAAQTTYPSDAGTMDPNTIPSGATTGNGTTVTSSPATAPGVPNTGTMDSTTGTGTPGVPNTGAGGDAASTMLLLTSSALAAILGGVYLYRRASI
jgi:hypothetical protein